MSRGASAKPRDSVTAREPVERRPGPLGVDVIGGDGRDATPVVDAGVEERTEVVAQVRWGLHVHVERQDEPGQRDRIEVDVVGARRGLVHRGAGLGQEVLHDDLLHVAVAGMGLRDRLQGCHPVGAVFADADEDPRGEGDAQPSRRVERGEPAFGSLVGRAPVAVEIGPQGLDHHPLAGAHRTQLGELVGEQRTGVGMGEQAGLVEHQAAHRREVVDGGRVTVLAEPRAGDGVALLGPLAQREERFVAAGLGAPAGDAQHVVGREVGRGEPRRGLGEGAVAALVPAEHRERDEHLGRVGDPGAVHLVAPGRGPRQQLGEGEGEHVVVQHERARYRQRAMVPS